MADNASSSCNSSPQSARMHYVDIAKGIGILAVIVGHIAIRLMPHSHLSEYTFIVIFSFHMPLFFILAGYVTQRNRAFRFAKEARRLLLPFLVCALVCIALLVVRVLFETKSLDSGRAVGLSWLNASFYGAGGIFSNPLWPQDARIGAIWFLLALFWAKLIMSFATRMRSGWIVTLACFAAGVISMNYVWLPWSVQAGLCATPFMWIGMRLRELRFFEKRLPVVLWIGLIVVWVAAIYLKNPVAMAGSFFGEWPYLAPVKIAGSIAGTLCVVKLSQCIEHHISLLARLFDVLGQASLGILCVHLVSDNVIDWSRMGDYALFELGIMMPLILLVFSLVRTCCESAVGLIVHKLWSKLVR